MASEACNALTFLTLCVPDMLLLLPPGVAGELHRG